MAIAQREAELKKIIHAYDKVNTAQQSIKVYVDVQPIAFKAL